MPITVVGSTASVTALTTNSADAYSSGPSLTLPSGTQAGDMMLLTVGYNDYAIHPVYGSEPWNLIVRHTGSGSTSAHTMYGVGVFYLTVTAAHISAGQIYFTNAWRTFSSDGAARSARYTYAITVIRGANMAFDVTSANVSGTYGNGGTNTTVVPSLVTTKTNDAMFVMWSYGRTISPNNYTTLTTNNTGTGEAWSFARRTSDTTATGTYGGESFSQTTYALAFAMSSNAAPNAPTNLFPPDNSQASRETAQNFTGTFSDPDSGDTMSAAQVRYRVKGTTTWSTVSASVSGTTYTAIFPAASLAGFIEWQARIADAAGTWGPWSATLTYQATAPTGGTGSVGKSIDPWGVLALSQAGRLGQQVKALSAAVGI